MSEKPQSDHPKSTKRTFIEDGTQFEGQLASTCHIVVCGKVEGELKAPKLTVTESGSVIGKVQAERIYSEGVLAGTIEADELYLSGQVCNNTVIRAKSMEVKLSQEGGRYEVTFGECTLSVGEDPRAEQQAAPEVTAAQAQSAEGGESPALQAAPAESGTEVRAPAIDAASGRGATAAPESAGEPVAVPEAGDGGGKRKGKLKRNANKAEGAEESAQASDDAAPMSTNSSPPPAP